MASLIALVQSLGLAYASGVSVYATVLLLGLAERAHWIAPLPGPLAVASNTIVLVITGVLTPKGLSPQGTDQDDIVIMPYTSAMKRVLGGNTLRGINVQVASPNALEPAQQQITARRPTPSGTSRFPILTSRPRRCGRPDQGSICVRSGNSNRCCRFFLSCIIS